MVVAAPLWALLGHVHVLRSCLPFGAFDFAAKGRQVLLAVGS